MHLHTYLVNVYDLAELECDRCMARGWVTYVDEFHTRAFLTNKTVDSLCCPVAGAHHTVVANNRGLSNIIHIVYFDVVQLHLS